MLVPKIDIFVKDKNKILARNLEMFPDMNRTFNNFWEKYSDCVRQFAGASIHVYINPAVKDYYGICEYTPSTNIARINIRYYGITKLSAEWILGHELGHLHDYATNPYVCDYPRRFANKEAYKASPQEIYADDFALDLVGHRHMCLLHPVVALNRYHDLLGL